MQKSQRWAKVQASPPSPSKPVDKQKEIRLFVGRWVGHAPLFKKRGGGGPPGPTLSPFRSHCSKPELTAIDHEVITLNSVLSAPTDSVLTKLEGKFLHSLIFIPFTKVTSAHPSMNYFRTSWCHMKVEFISYPNIYI